MSNKQKFVEITFFDLSGLNGKSRMVQNNFFVPANVDNKWKHIHLKRKQQLL